MFTVVITEKDGDERRVTFTEPEVTVGRVPGNDVVLPKGNVSKRHSRIVLKDNRFIVVDLKSTNGTYVNGRKITSPLVVKEGDKIYVGDYILTLENPPQQLDALRPPSLLASPADGAQDDGDANIPVVLRGGLNSSSIPPPSAGGATRIEEPPDEEPILPAEGELEEFEERPSREQERSSERDAALLPFHPDMEARLPGRAFGTGQRVADSATRDTLLGPLDFILADPSVSHVVIDRFDRIRADRGAGLKLEQGSFTAPDALVELANEIGAQAGVPLDAASYDVALANGLHIVAILPAAASNGPLLSIRRRPTRLDTLAELHQRGLISRTAMMRVEDALRQRRHIWLIGPSGTDLASFTASVLAACAPEDRVALFERAPEVAVGDRAVLCLKLGAVSVDELLERVRAFRPDRLAMSGVREEELQAVLEAFAHRPEGNIASFEARSAKEALSAFDRAVGPDVTLRAASLFLELRRTDEGKTRVAAAYDIELDASGDLTLHAI